MKWWILEKKITACFHTGLETLLTGQIRNTATDEIVLDAGPVQAPEPELPPAVVQVQSEILEFR